MSSPPPRLEVQNHSRLVSDPVGGSCRDPGGLCLNQRSKPQHPRPCPAPFTDPIMSLGCVTPLVSKPSSRVCLGPCYLPPLGRGAWAPAEARRGRRGRAGEALGCPISLQLDITKLHMSGAPTPGQPDSGKRLRVPDAALRAARPARPVPPRCGARTPLDRLGQTLWNRPTAAWGPHLPWSPGPGQAGAGRRGWEIDDFVYSTA